MSEFTHPDNLDRKDAPDGFDGARGEVEEFLDDIILREDDDEYENRCWKAEDHVMELLHDVTDVKDDIDHAKSTASRNIGAERGFSPDVKPEDLYYKIEELGDDFDVIWEALDGVKRQIDNAGAKITDEARHWKVKSEARTRELDEITNFMTKLANALDVARRNHNYVIGLYEELYEEYKELKEEKKSLETKVSSASVID